MRLAPWLLGRLLAQRAWWGNTGLLALDVAALGLAHDAGGRPAWLAALGFVCASGLAAWAANLRRARLIDDVPTSRIASAAQGYMELQGQARQFPDHLLPARLSQTPCVWYRYQIETRDAGGNWRVEEYGEADDSFLLKDDSGQCIIDPDGAEILTSRRRSWTESDHRYTEWLLLPGDALYAIGEFTTLAHPASPADLKADVGALLAHWKRDPAALRQRFDANGDGEIDLTEWEAARTAARQEVEARERARLAAGPLHLLRKPRDGRPFLLSNLEPERLGRRYRRWAFAHLAVFLAACAGLAGYL